MNNYEIPAIGFSEAATENLGKYGRMRKQYIQSAQAGALQQPSAVWDTVRTPAGNRPDSPQTLGSDDAGDGESSRCNKGTESSCSFALGRSDEHLQGAGGRSHFE